MNVRSWLRRVPQPVKVRLDRKKEVRVGEGKNKWRDVLDVINVEQPAVIEAIDAEGSVIRMTELADAGDKEEQSKELERAKLPPELAMLPALAELLLQAYVKGAEQHARAYELAFHENTKLVTALSQQTRVLQSSLDAQLEARLSEVAAGGPGGESALGEILNGPLAPMLQALLTKHMLPASSDEKTSNGKHRTKGA